MSDLRPRCLAEIARAMLHQLGPTLVARVSQSEGVEACPQFLVFKTGQDGRVVVRPFLALLGADVTRLEPPFAQLTL
jgi:hypothetical protein